MPLYSYLRLLCLVLLVTACREKRTDNRRWYKGNLHTHSYWSDGDEYPEMVMDWYKSHGYNFVALTDHNTLAEGEKWITVPKSRLYEDDFNKYLEKYGEQWVTYKRDSGRIQVKLKTFTEYKPLFEDENFLIIQSEEISDSFAGKPIHINATNVQRVIKPGGGESVSDVMQHNLDAVLRQRQETGVPMFPHINHPNFHFAIAAEDLMKLHGERFFEVFNGHPEVFNYGNNIHPDTEYIWDLVNLDYHRKNQPFLLGLATDDTHSYHEFGAAYAHAGRGWVMVLADSLTPASLIRAMEAGDFYATTGVLLDDIKVALNTLTIKVNEERGVHYEIQFVGASEQDQTSRILKRVPGPSASIELLDSYVFVRAKIISDKPKENPFYDGDFETAWTQPVNR
jgi:hypothetical protein